MCEELLSGMSYCWMGSDPTGQIAVFHSGSFARIPTLFSKDLQAYEQEVRPFANDLLEQLPTISTYKVGAHPEPMDNVRHAGNLLQEDAARGMYVYDMAQHLADCEYYCAYVPDRPLLFADLFESERKQLRNFIVNFIFANTPTLTKSRILAMFS